MPLPAYCRPEAFDLFRLSVRAAETSQGLFRAAAAITLHAHPEERIDDAERVIEELAETVQRRVQSDSDEARLAHLHDVLFDVVGFRGNTDDYYDPVNSYLPVVLRRRRGIPITLVLVYKAVAERVGLRVEGVNAPGHFLAAVTCRESAGERVLYVDPFYDGSLLTAEEAYERIRAATGRAMEPDPALLRRATPQAWLSRMLVNLQAIFARQGNERDLYAMEELRALVTELER